MVSPDDLLVPQLRRIAEIQRIALKDARTTMHKFREKDLHTLSVNEKLDTDIALEEQEVGGFSDDIPRATPKLTLFPLHSS